MVKPIFTRQRWNSFSWLFWFCVSEFRHLSLPILNCVKVPKWKWKDSFSVLLQQIVPFICSISILSIRPSSMWKRESGFHFIQSFNFHFRYSSHSYFSTKKFFVPIPSFRELSIFLSPFKISFRKKSETKFNFREMFWSVSEIGSFIELGEKPCLKTHIKTFHVLSTRFFSSFFVGQLHFLSPRLSKCGMSDIRKRTTI